MDKPKYPVQTVLKAMEVLELLAEDGSNKGLGITELDRKIGLGKSTIHRMLETLAYCRLVEKDAETGKYRLGWRLYSMGQIVPRQHQLYNLDPAPLLALNAATGETVNIGVLSGNEVVIISKIEDVKEPLRAGVTQGKHEDIHATSLGKVLISELSDGEIARLVSEPMKACTPNTITSLDRLIRAARAAGEQGYAVDNEELSLGLYCIAMPLRDYTGKIIAALSVSTPAARMNEDKRAAIIARMAVAQKQISATLGYMG